MFENVHNTKLKDRCARLAGGLEIAADKSDLQILGRVIIVYSLYNTVYPA